MAELPNNPAHIWAPIQRLGVNENVNSYAEYERLCFIGAREAKAFLTEDRPDPASPQTCRIVHAIMFQDIHPWAGAFRTTGESVIISGYPAADAWRVPSELALLQTQLDRWGDLVNPLGLNSEQTTACRISFHHIRFERIHPFRDGNGRAGRLLLGAAVTQTFGEWSNIDWDAQKPRYFAALAAGNKRNVQPLANLILDAFGLDEISTEVRSPFRVAPRMFEQIAATTLDDDLQWSLRPW
jgi:fido (protein-threonine AMPylation protein)